MKGKFVQEDALAVLNVKIHRNKFRIFFLDFQYLGVLQGVWRGMVGGRGGEGVLVAVPGQHALDGDNSEFGKGQVPEIGTDTRKLW